MNDKPRFTFQHGWKQRIWSRYCWLDISDKDLAGKKFDLVLRPLSQCMRGDVWPWVQFKFNPKDIGLSLRCSNYRDEAANEICYVPLGEWKSINWSSLYGVVCPFLSSGARAFVSWWIRAFKPSAHNSWPSIRETSSTGCWSELPSLANTDSAFEYPLSIFLVLLNVCLFQRYLRYCGGSVLIELRSSFALMKAMF